MPQVNELSWTFSSLKIFMLVLIFFQLFGFMPMKNLKLTNFFGLFSFQIFIL